MNVDWTTTLISLSGAFLVGVFTRWPMEKLAERRAFVRQVSDGYLNLARVWVADTDNQYWRFRTLQQQQAARLRWWELNRVCNQIVSAGFADPRHRMNPVFRDRRRKLGPLLRWAGRNRVDLSDGELLGNLSFDERMDKFCGEWIGVENFHAGSVQRSRRRATDSLQGTRWYIRTRTHRINRWVL